MSAARAARPRVRRISARASGLTVDEYIGRLDGWRREAAMRLREIVRSAAPRAVESIKWGQPVYESDGPFCYIRAFASSINLGFWRGKSLAHLDDAIVGGGEKMGHFRIGSPADIRPDAFARVIREAVQLNARHGDPTRR